MKKSITNRIVQTLKNVKYRILNRKSYSNKHAEMHGIDSFKRTITLNFNKIKLIAM